MQKHHIIPRHEWKVRFGTLRGFNALDNLVVLTVEQHALAHKFLYELNKKTEDLVAWKGLAGLIDCEEAHREICRMNGLNTMGRKRSQETKEKQRSAALERWCRPGEREAQRARNTGINNPCYGKRNSIESNQKRSVTLMGRIVSTETRKKMSEWQLGLPKKKKVVI